MGVENIKPDKDKNIKSPLEKLEELKKQKEEEEKLRKEREEKESIERYLSEKGKLDDLISQRDEIKKRLDEIKSRQTELIGEYHETVKEARKDKTTEDILHTKEGFETVFSDLMGERKELAKEAEELNKRLKEIENQIPLQEEKVKDLFYKTPEGREQKKREEEREYLKKYIDLDKLPPISQIKEKGLDVLFSNFNKEEFKNLSEEEKERVKQLIIEHLSYDIDNKLKEKFNEINEKIGVNDLKRKNEEVLKKLERYDERVDEICTKLKDLNNKVNNYLNEYKDIIEKNKYLKKNLEEYYKRGASFIIIFDLDLLGIAASQIDYWIELLQNSKNTKNLFDKPKDLKAYDLDKIENFISEALNMYEEFNKIFKEKIVKSPNPSKELEKSLQEIKNKYPKLLKPPDMLINFSNIFSFFYDREKEYNNTLEKEKNLIESLKENIIKGAELYLDKIYSEKEVDKANKEIEAIEKENEYFKNIENKIYNFWRFFYDELKYIREDEKKLTFNNEGKPGLEFVTKTKEEINKINYEIKNIEEEIKKKEKEKKEIESKLIFFSKGKKIEEKNKEIKSLNEELERLKTIKYNLERKIRFTEDKRYKEAMKFIKEELPQLEKYFKIKEKVADPRFNYEEELKNGNIEGFFGKLLWSIIIYINKLDSKKSEKTKKFIFPYEELKANIENINKTIKSSLDNLDKIKIEDLIK